MTQSASRPGTRSINKLALTMCTLLSSQGPDALPTRHHEDAPPERLSFSNPPMSSNPATQPCNQTQWLIPKERTGGVVILSVEANQHKARSELQWRMVPLEGRRALGFRSSRSAAPLG